MSLAALSLSPTKRQVVRTKRKFAGLDVEPNKTFERPAAHVPEFKRERVEPKPVDDIPIVGVSFDELGPQHCRWPIGDPREEDFHFCGRQKSHGISYCDRHAQKAFQPLVIRRRAKDIP